MWKALVVCVILSAQVASSLVLADQVQPGTRILRRVVKSTPTATNLARIRMVTVRSANNDSAVTEITSKEAARFGQRDQLVINQTGRPGAEAASTKTRQSQPILASANITTSTTTTAIPPAVSNTSRAIPTTTTAATTTTISSTTTTGGAIKIASPTPSSSTIKPPADVKTKQQKASERQQASSTAEVEVLSGSSSSWQNMMAVEAPAAMLIAAGTRPAIDLHTSGTSSSAETISGSSSGSVGEILRSSAATKSGVYHQSVSEQSFSRVQDHHLSTIKTNQQQQQSYFYPKQQLRASSKTQPPTKTVWYQPSSSSTTTTPRPAPLIQQVEPQLEQYVEQQADYGAAPLGQAEPFAFDFTTRDQDGNGQYRREESDKNGVVRGSYGYTDANGIYRHVEYIADENGFRANIKSNEPGLQTGETQPASIQYLTGAPEASVGVVNTNSLNNPRLTASAPDDINRSGEWSANGNQFEATAAAVAPRFGAASPNQGDRFRAPRHYHQ